MNGAALRQKRIAAVFAVAGPARAPSGAFASAERKSRHGFRNLSGHGFAEKVQSRRWRSCACSDVGARPAPADFANEQTSLFDHFESIFWPGAAILSFLGAGIGWIASLPRGRNEDPVHRYGAALLEILRRIRTADAGEIEKQDEELEDVVEAPVELRNSDQFGSIIAPPRRDHRPELKKFRDFSVVNWLGDLDSNQD